MVRNAPHERIFFKDEGKNKAKNVIFFLANII